MKKKILALAVCLLLACTCAYAGVLKPTDEFYVNDDANVLETDTEGMIIFSNDLLYEDCGAQFAVVVAESIGNEDIGDYAYDLFNEWGIGDSKKDNGFLMLLAIEEENYYFLPGSGLDTDMSWGKIGGIVDDYLEPYFAKGEYDEGVDKVFRQLFPVLAKACGSKVTVDDGIEAYEEYMESGASQGGSVSYDYEPREESRKRSGIPWYVILIIIVIVFSVISKARSAARGRRMSGVNFINISAPRVHRPHRAPGGPVRTVRTRSFSAKPGGGRTTRSSFGGGRSTFGSSSRSSGGRSSFGGGRSGGFGGGRSGGGGGSRGGGGGRGR